MLRFGLIRKLAAGLDSIIFPRKCAVCKGPVSDDAVFEVCATCMTKFVQKPAHSCAVCAEPIDGEVADAGISKCGRCRTKAPQFDATFYGLRYEGTARELIHRFKFNRAFRLAATVSSPLCAELFSQPSAREADVIAPVPLHWRRNYERGFNQSYLIALEIGRALSKPVDANLLARRRHTKPQYALTAAERNDNIKGAFAVRRPETLEGKIVVLVDDIVTTGSTVSEAAKTLKKAGAKKVIVAAAARA
jgi:ComF family protein